MKTFACELFLPNKVFDILAPFLPPCKKFVETQKESLKIINTWVDQSIENKQKRNNTPADKNKDYIGQLMAFCYEYKVELSCVTSDINALFLGGTTPIAIVIERCILYLAKYPNIQEIIFKQLVSKKLNLKTNYGNLKLLESCYYLKAFVFEVLRFNGMVGTSPPRLVPSNVRQISFDVPNACTNDTFDKMKAKQEFKKLSYNIPKNSLICADMLTVCHDETVSRNAGLKFDIFNWLVATDDGKDDDGNDGNDDKHGVGCKYKFNTEKFLPCFS